MDFGHQNFRNEIVWCYASGGVSTRYFGKKHDIILFYTKTKKYQFNPQYRPYSKGTLQRGLTTYKKKLNENYTLRKEGAIQNDWWSDVTPLLSPTSKERLGYPTQKPITLLNRIILASSNPGDTVFDPFCGCGTTIYSAEKNNRKWIGCDIAILAIKLIRHKLEEKYNLVEGTHFVVDGIPVSIEQAEDLFKRDPFQFQHWFIELVGGFPIQKKVADKGIDGKLYFETGNGLKEMVLSVKGGDSPNRFKRFARSIR